MNDEARDYITTCALCGRRTWFSDTCSPGDEAICTKCAGAGEPLDPDVQCYPGAPKQPDIAWVVLDAEPTDWPDEYIPVGFPSLVVCAGEILRLPAGARLYIWDTDGAARKAEETMPLLEEGTVRLLLRCDLHGLRHPTGMASSAYVQEVTVLTRHAEVQAITDEHVRVAKLLAMAAHSNQLYGDGTPYILHAKAVADRVRGDNMAEASAWIHDVLEDCDGWTPGRMADHGIPWGVIRVVERLTKPRGVAYEDYLGHVAQCPVARKVKIADMLTNISAPGASERLIVKYAKGLLLLHQPPIPNP